jgi:hypothetical protein
MLATKSSGTNGGRMNTISLVRGIATDSKYSCRALEQGNRLHIGTAVRVVP